MLDASHSVDLDAARAAVKRLGSKLLCVIGSTPSYALGTIDPIEELAAMARTAGVGMHVDSCLGGFVVNYLDHVDPNWLALDGVTSLSCDTHKNGWAPKGSSVLVTKKASHAPRHTDTSHRHRHCDASDTSPTRH